jgi:hypothetical protein
MTKKEISIFIKNNAEKLPFDSRFWEIKPTEHSILKKIISKHYQTNSFRPNSFYKHISRLFEPNEIYEK